MAGHTDNKMRVVNIASEEPIPHGYYVGLEQDH
jgi:hypothetical protein